MKPTRRLSIAPGTALGFIALFFALGGSAFAVGERIQSPSVAQQRCTNGAVRGVATVVGDPSKGLANIPDQFTSANAIFSRKFNCTVRAVQVRRVDTGVYEVRFVGNSAPSAVVNALGPSVGSAVTIAPGTFRISLYGAGNAGAGDGAFVVAAV
jgi:hypothetical protein